MIRVLIFIVMLVPLSALAQQQDAPLASPPQEHVPMTLERLALIVQAIDGDVVISGPTLELSIGDVPVLVVTDPAADRMRAMVPVASAAGLAPDDLLRMMQANFDTALDARYAVANGRLWAVFIHPLAALQKDQFLSGLAQTVNLARTYGQSYSGGAQIFGGGDSAALYRDLIEELRKKGEAL
jgi:hypothetical protein